MFTMQVVLVLAAENPLAILESEKCPEIMVTNNLLWLKGCYAEQVQQPSSLQLFLSEIESGNIDGYRLSYNYSGFTCLSTADPTETNLIVDKRLVLRTAATLSLWPFDFSCLLISAIP